MPYTKRSGPFQTAVAHSAVPVRLHYVTIVGTTGPPAVEVDHKLSSPNMSVVRTNVGRYTIGFPAGGLVALGWLECGLLNPTVQGNTLQAWASAPTDYETGVASIRLLTSAGAGADLVGRMTVSVFCLCDHSNN